MENSLWTTYFLLYFFNALYILFIYISAFASSHSTAESPAKITAIMFASNVGANNCGIKIEM